MSVLLGNPAPIANLPQWDQLLGALVATGAYGLLGIFLMLVGFKMFEWITGAIRRTKTWMLLACFKSSS